MRVAVVFSRFGPYHLARLDAAGRVLASQGGEVVGIEVASTDRTYAWDAVQGGEHFAPKTLFSDQVYDDVGKRRIWNVIHEVLDECGPHCVAVPGWACTEAVAALAWARERGISAVLMSESARDDAERRRFSEWIKRRVVNLCDAALVGGSRHASYTAELGMPSDRIFLGYDTIDNRHFAAGAEEARTDATHLRKTHHLPQNYFVASCRFVKKKNLPGLLVAFAEYRQKAGAEAWDLVVCGDGELRGRVEAQRVELGLEASVHLPGFIQYDDLPVYFGLAGAFVHVSTVEQWGLAVNEALACGLPAIVSDTCGCSPELVADGETGFLVDPLDSHDIARRMLELSRDGDLRERMGLAAERLIAKWSSERFGAGLAAACAAAASHSDRVAGGFDKLLLRLLGLR